MPGICGTVFSPLPDLKKHLGMLLRTLDPERRGEFSDWTDARACFGMRGGKIWQSEDFVILFDGQAPFNDSREPFEQQLAESYKEKGDEFIENLPGPFALALYDIKNQELSLYRDRLGQKPLYWIYTPEGFVFSSELKGILASNLLTLSLDTEAISDYLIFGYTPLEKTLIQDVYKLLPGHYLKIKKECQHRIRPYWRLGSIMQEKQNDWTFASYEELVATALKEKDEPKKGQGYVYSHESETALIKKFFPENTIIPIKASLNDVLFSQEAIERAFEELPEMVWHLDEPVGHLYGFSSWMVFNAVKERGCGSIILPIGSLAWIERHLQKPMIRRAAGKKIWSLFLKLMVQTSLTRKLLPLKTFRSLKMDPWDLAILQRQFWVPKEIVKGLIRPPLQLIDEEVFLHYFPSLENIGHTLTSLFYLMYKVPLPQLYLHTVECFSKALNIHISLPFLDDKVAKYLLSIPNNQVGSKSETSLANLFTKESAKRHFQENLWKMLAKAPSFEKHKHYIFEGTLLEAGLVSKAMVEAMWKRRGIRPYFQALWSLLQLEIWLYRFFEKRLQ